MFERVFHFLFFVTNSYGWAILLISVLISVMLMPFYRITNILEGREKTIRLRLQPYISRINKIKNERAKHKHLLELYKSYNYSPIMSLRSLLYLVIQVPFFIAAYQALSKILIANPYNSNMSFLFIKNLGLQDNLMGGVNLLPILMTVINMLAVMCMTSFPKERRQGYSIAVFFLILLYMSPAGLVLYWTSNNLINLFRYLFIYLKDKEFLAIKRMLIVYPSRLLKRADIRIFLLLVAVYFVVNTTMLNYRNGFEYSSIIVVPCYILFFLKLYEYKIKIPFITKNVKIQLSLILFCFIVSFFVVRWEKAHWLFAALTLFVIYDYKSIKLVKVKKIFKSLLTPLVTGMLLPAVLYAKANPIYVTGCGVYSYFLMLTIIACFIPLAIYVYNVNCSISKTIKISLSFILAVMFLPLIRAVVKYPGSLPYDFIFLLFIIYFIIDLFWKKKKVITVFFISAIPFLLFSSKIDLSTEKSRDEVTVQVPEELLTMPMKGTPAVYLFMYDAFPHRELIAELGLDISGLDALLHEYQFKEYDVYSTANHTLATMGQVFDIQRHNIDNELFRKIIAGSNLVNTVFGRHGYNNFISAKNDPYMFPAVSYIKCKLLGVDDINESKVNFVISLGVIRSIVMGSMDTGVLLEKRDCCSELAKFANRSAAGIGGIFAWGMSDYPGHSSNRGKGFEYEFKSWETRYYESMENMKMDLKLAISNNPNAIVILMSDHGPFSLADSVKKYEILRDDQIKRAHFRGIFGAFMAIRWPDKERATKYDKEFNITQDLFPIVFAYLCDSPMPLKYKIKDTAVRVRDHKFDKGVFYPDFYKAEEN